MASATFNTLQLLHVVGAMVVVGYLAIIPMWRAALRKDAEPTVVRAFLETVSRVQMMVVLPALAVIIVTGLLMTWGPLHEVYRFSTSVMSKTGLGIALVLSVILVMGLGAPTRKMLALVEKGEGQGPAMDKLWGDWRTALLAATVLALAATALMVFNAVA